MGHVPIVLLSLLTQALRVSSLSVPPASRSSPIITPEVIRSYSLFEPTTARGRRRKCVGWCREVSVPPKDINEEEDEVELLYSTSRRSYLFPRGGYGDTGEGRDDDRDQKMVQVTIRQTSFGCGRLGATVWPSGIALACYLSGGARHMVEGKRILELGSGCGVPTVVARDACGASEVLATDFWEEEGGRFDGDRLVPKGLFGVNLEYNVGDVGKESSVRRLDWHDQWGVIVAANQFKPDVIVGSDLVYYPMDVAPLIRTLDTLLRSGAKDAILFCPLPPTAEREALPEFRTRLAKGELEECNVSMDEVKMDLDGGTEGHYFLRIVISKS